MKKFLFFALLISITMLPGITWAAGDIFDKLAGKATIIGGGFQQAGFLIAGLGMIVFTFMAIFNKLQWKHLAYIMFSTAVLSAMVALISYFSDGRGRANLSFKGGYTDVTYDAKGVPAKK